jgi:hypothetical protein
MQAIVTGVTAGKVRLDFQLLKCSLVLTSVRLGCFRKAFDNEYALARQSGHYNSAISEQGDPKLLLSKD